MNLFLILFFLDSQVLSVGSSLYIFGHSFATAGAFIAVHYLERFFGSRLTVEISGALGRSGMCALVGTMVFLSFIDFPLFFFFWGEVWLWALVVDFIPLVGFFLMLLATVVYTWVLCRLWLGILFGGVSLPGSMGLNELGICDLFLVLYVYGFQFLVGLQPSLLGWVIF